MIYGHLDVTMPEADLAALGSARYVSNEPR